METSHLSLKRRIDTTDEYGCKHIKVAQTLSVAENLLKIIHRYDPGYPKKNIDFNWIKFQQMMLSDMPTACRDVLLSGQDCELASLTHVFFSLASSCEPPLETEMKYLVDICVVTALIRMNASFQLLFRAQETMLSIPLLDILKLPHCSFIQNEILFPFFQTILSMNE